MPLVIFVVAYWKILKVVRRQAKVAAERYRRPSTTAASKKKPIAEATGGPSKIQVASMNEKTEKWRSIMKGAVAAGLRRGQVVRTTLF